MSLDAHHSVLVVDDDDALARMLRVLLESEDCHVRIAHNGREALACLTEFTPDVILLDLQMPVMDGRSFYTEFRALGYETPVMLLSAYNAQKVRNELGADDAMDKPCDPDVVIERIQRLIERARSRASVRA